ncbi:putative HAD-hydrolase [Halalkalicoccus paucihalophilus]|uniref:Putative HAD-hydrolase n=1 Tax=Halalkalicoccus paucihalophilus TaxID=1008153 RepID=A0A151A8N5_9EURY|nr:haloacid dehalogenase type II [Halalkalicoccus paucihalophilus]KYH24056.1 putative HAD-hydrolase [Halalkalicoccus paucihalophilus]
MTEVLCFDVYGSTHNQHSVTDTLEAVTGLPSPIVQDMSEMWVEYQISYSMEVTLMRDYRSWWDLTTESLDYVLDYYGVNLTDTEYQRVMEAYKHLEPYEDLANFGQLRDAGHELYILSDGNQDMLTELAENTGFDEYLTGIVSVEDVEVFKPHPKAYENIENYTDRSLEDCTMVATHTFDVAGAQAAGMKTILVNRFNVPATRLSHTPDMVVDSYAELADHLSGE